MVNLKRILIIHWPKAELIFLVIPETKSREIIRLGD